MAKKTTSAPAPKSKTTTNINFKIDRDLQESFKSICEREGYPQSLVIRELIKKYVAKNGQGDLFK